MVIPDRSDFAGIRFEETIQETVSELVGLTTDEIESRLETILTRSAKGYRTTLVRRMIEASGDYVAGSGRFGISIRSILLNKQGNMTESLSFPVFRYMGEGGLLEEDWETCETDKIPRIKRLLEDTRFLFAVFQKSGADIRFKGVKFWSMPKPDIEGYVEPVWQMTYRCIEQGRIQDLPRITFNGVCHIRPHARNSNDTFPTPWNGEQVKRSFWLDKRYIRGHLDIVVDDGRSEGDQKGSFATIREAVPGSYDTRTDRQLPFADV